MKSPKILYFVLPVLLFSCENLLFEEDLATTDPKTNFEYLWQACHERYAYFDLKEIDWEQVKLKYEPAINENMSEDSLFNVLGAMLDELRDDHTNLISNFNVSFYGVDDRNPDNFDWRIVKDHYLSPDYYISGPFIHDFVQGSNNEIGYLRFSSFTGTVDADNLDFALSRYRNTRGLILDLRENGGGAVADIFEILSRFADFTQIIYFSRIKNGPGINDFSDPEPATLRPSPGIRYTQNKVMVLVDRGTYSAGSFTALATKALPNLVLVGDTTGGGLGLPNGGQLPIGWLYRFSISQTLDLNFDHRYENGVPPDIQAYLDRSNLSRDEIIERALLELN